MHTTARRIAVALLALGLATTAPAHAQLGIAGGLNFESAGDIETTTNSSATLDNSTGYHIGLVYELGLGPLTLRPGVFYRRVGTFQFSNVPADFQSDNQSFDVAAWQVPVDVRLTVLPLPLIKPYILAGPMLTFPRSEGALEDATSDASLSLNVGVGTSISLPTTSIQLQPELRYEFGATKFISEDADLPGGVGVSDSPRFSAFGLRLNVVF